MYSKGGGEHSLLRSLFAMSLACSFTFFTRHFAPTSTFDGTSALPFLIVQINISLLLVQELVSLWLNYVFDNLIVSFSSHMFCLSKLAYPCNVSILCVIEHLSLRCTIVF
jgi:hypothetical protein